MNRNAFELNYQLNDMHNNTDELLIATKFFVSETVPTYEVPRDKKTETRLRLRNGKHSQAVDT